MGNLPIVKKLDINRAQAHGLGFQNLKPEPKALSSRALSRLLERAMLLNLRLFVKSFLELYNTHRQAFSSTLQPYYYDPLTRTL